MPKAVKKNTINKRTLTMTSYLEWTVKETKRLIKKQSARGDYLASIENYHTKVYAEELLRHIKTGGFTEL